MSDAERRERLAQMRETNFASVESDASLESDASVDADDEHDPDEEWATDGLVDWVLSGGAATPASATDPPQPPSPELLEAYASLDADFVRAFFPDETVGLDVAEGVDDLVPDPDRADAESLAAAFEIIDAGLDRCAVLKELTRRPMFAQIAREKRTAIRTQKGSILRLRKTLEGRQRVLDKEAADREKEDQAWRDAGVERPTGFAAWGGKPGDAAAARRRAEDRRKLLKDAREYERKVFEGIMEKRRIAMEKQNKEFLRMIQGRRY